MRLVDAFQSSTSVVAVMRASDGVFLGVNPAFERSTGYRRDQVTGRLPVEIGLWPDPAFRSQIWSLLRGDHRAVALPMHLRHADGRILPGHLNVEFATDADGETVVFCLLHLATEPAAPGETAPSAPPGFYRALYLAASEGIYRSLPGGGFLDVNPAMARILGYDSPAQLLQEVAREASSLYVDPESATHFHTRLQAGERLERVRARVRRRDGGIIWVSENARGIFDEQGKVLFYEGSLVDITAQVEAEEALRQSRTLYQVLVENSRDGVFLIQRGKVAFANQALASILGYEVPELTGMDYMSLVDPADIEAQMARRAAREAGSPAPQVYEVRLRRRDGRVILCEVRADAVQYEGDIASTGTLRDVTEERARQRAIEDAERRYRTLVEHSQVGVFIMDGDRYTYANTAFTQMLGLGEGELVGRGYREIMAPEAVPASEQRDRDRAAGRPVPSDFETCLLHRDGRRVFVRVSIGPVELDGVEHLTGTVLDVTRQREAESRLRFHATHDPLTGLPNRMLFNQKLAGAMLAAGRAGGQPYAVLFLDLDGFKWVNDSLGHGAGDGLLVQIARRLEDSLLQDVLIARYGGDEFTLLPEGPCDEARAAAIARQVIALFEQPFDAGGQQVFSSASLGIVLGRPDYESPEQVLRDADTAMYRAKSAGKSGFVVFDEGMHQQALSRLQLETDLRLAFERAEFRVHYQPIIELASGRLVGAEALVRWLHPRRGLLAPAEFLPLAEESGLITQLDAWVLGEACAQLGQWRQVAPGLSMNVNVDERQMVAPGLVDEVLALLHRHQLPADSLRLEVTETAFRSGRGEAERHLLSLKAIGVGLVVDDFGTGYSSLESFASSPFDALKMDQVFIRDIETNPRHRAIVRTINGFAGELGLALTAEGIETEGQREMLRAIGCQFGQGFLFSRALPPEQFEQMLSAGAGIVG
ncbi:MAG: hypothetical protein ABS41_10620 [Arenimonas sp. SCN 70-307]|uniref:EAL domain-containing protein n=1 Tax=Arenimonas sp. SCN 70-307 TaxID=1660089 RepID=UPI00086AE098|nr:EAL domain-containing protein [Arenimonas sp. SCN 70-307]ODS62284.1 MAG: hypothetical protein ABS41_10620 [Arenimonas sp. SCN 70-307]